jgi:hypothetical protein
MGEQVSQVMQTVLKEAAPEHTFKLHKTMIEIRNISELAEALEIMSNDSFAHHVNDKKNDFATWLKDIIGDEELSKRLKGVVDKQKALAVVRQRLKETQKQATATYTYQSTLFGFGLWDVIIGFVAGLIIGLFLGHFLMPAI